MSSNMKKRETDSYSTASAASKASRERHKSSRFSLRRLNPFLRHQSSSAKSVRSARSSTELETRSISSLQTSHSGDRDNVVVSLGEEAAQPRGPLPRNHMECPLCLSAQHEALFPPVSTCHHRSCRECLRQYLKIEIMESRVNIACPECAERFHPNDIKAILEDEVLLKKYEEFMLRRILVTEPDARWCPAPDCGYAVIASGRASCPKLRCERPGCDTFFCYHCKQYWHPNQTCDAARAERASNMRSSSMSYSPESNSQNVIKPCPRCGAFIIKMDDGSCNHMTCAVCGAEFCWLCMKEISDLHYLSPSGCTFWGKKPWSRKKKILWQLGTLVGAPVGIGLFAGIAVPAMVIGIPIWVGRKLHAKYEHAPKHKRNLVITGGVSASVIFSPLLAGLAVSIGVPILLAYVYGVVPISLCRSGGCGVTTTNSGGVRFEFEEENDVTVGVSRPYTNQYGGDAQSMDATSHHLTNPSIGPSIGEMSMGMTNSLSASGSHMDRVGLLRDESDRDSASNRAIVGTSLNGSLSGSAVAGPSGFHNRLEVQADVATGSNKRNSLSSESANFSLDAKSATVSFADDASTKALAGSICTRDKDNSSNVIPPMEVPSEPLEVMVDVEGMSALYRNNSEDSTGSATVTASQTKSSPDSPTSSRSVNFITEEVIGGHYTRSKRYKHQSLSVGDRINEHSEHNLECLSVRSYNEEEYSIDVKGNQAMAGTLMDTHYHGTSRRSPPCSSMSCDSMPSSRLTSSPSDLTEVESDRPAGLYSRLGPSRLDGSSSEASTSEASSSEAVSPDGWADQPRRLSALEQPSPPDPDHEAPANATESEVK